MLASNAGATGSGKDSSSASMGEQKAQKAQPFTGRDWFSGLIAVTTIALTVSLCIFLGRVMGETVANVISDLIRIIIPF